MHGFKSFAEPTQIDLEPGMTVIVGPNGCGKSNITDAIRWVLGEQSAKAMRGGKMHDVIFAGTEARKALPFSQVSLVFTDCEDALGSQYHEVEISRKVTREESSDYFLNGKLCRLKDIQNLFMDTGIGQVSYSFMVQGQVDQILSSNPLERRSIFEEAAGITKYKTQRKETLNKLNLVEANLTRVTDIIEEISKRIGTLKRQASKALRFERQRHKLTHLELAWNSFQYASLNNESAELKKNHEVFEGKLEGIRDQLQQQNQRLAALKAEKADLFENLENLKNRIYQTRSNKENCSHQASLKTTRIDHLNERIEQLENDLAAIKTEESELTHLNSDTDTKIVTEKGKLAEFAEVAKQWESKVGDIDLKLKEHSNTLNENRQSLLISESQINQHRASCTKLEVNLEGYQNKHSDLMESFHRYQSELEELQKRSETLEKHEASKNKEKDANAAQLKEVLESIQSMDSNLRERQSTFAELEKKYAQIKAEQGILEDLQKKMEGFGEGTKAILKGELKDIINPESLIVLSKFIEVDKAHQVFCENILGNLLESVVIQDSKDALKAGKQLTELNKGKANFLNFDLIKDRKTTTQNVDGLTPASDLIKSSQSKWDDLLQNLLTGYYFAEDLETAVAAVKANPDLNFYLIGTANGELLSAKGVITVGKSTGKSGSFLQRQNELKALTGEIQRIEASIKEANETIEGIIEKIDTSKGKRNELRDIVNTIDREISSINTEKQGIRQNITRNEARVESYETQIKQLDENKLKQEQDLVASQNRLKEAEAEIESRRDLIDQQDQAVAELRNQKDAHYQELAAARLKLSEQRQAVSGLEQEIFNNQGKKAALEKRQQHSIQEQQHSREIINSLKVEIEKDNARIQELEQEEKQQQEILQREEIKYGGLDKQITTIETQLDELLKAEREEQEHTQQLTLKLSQKDIYLESIRDKVTQDYEREIDAIDWKQELWKSQQKVLPRVNIDDLDDDADISSLAKDNVSAEEATEEQLAELDNTNWEEVQEEIQTLRTKINAMGPVNTLAIEEYTDLKERFSFLKSQSDDLWASKNQLVEAIDEINKTSEKLFRETFDKITENFKSTYNQLTGGGEADLKLLDAEDVLDSGIEIIARPPGTRLRSISLLSGGQKTMTAVALLFAIYIVKPAPFCVLDELDAPLDDANIGRFVDMLKDFTRFSQFLIVSHNKRTIACADSIFGVTMEEKGVSKLISMRFNSDKDLVEDMAANTAA